MERRVIYCSACDRNVQVVLGEGGGSGPDPKLYGAVCLDIGEACTGTMCPVGAISPDRIRRELEEMKERGDV